MATRRLGLVLCLLAAGPAARADRIVLRSGGEIRGIVLPDPSRPKVLLVQTETAARPLALDRDRVAEVVAEPGPLADYRRKMAEAEVEGTGEAHYRLGLWCDEHKLRGPAEVQYRLAVGLDSGIEGAHKKLGHVLHEGRWVSYDEQREAIGLIKYKGKWVSPQEKAELDGKAALGAGQATWARRIRAWRQALLGGPPAASAEAEGQLVGIREAAAVRPLVEILGADAEGVRLVMTRALSAIAGPESSLALLNRLFDEPDLTLRGLALQELARRKEPAVQDRLVRLLRVDDPRVVGRAAWALAGLKADSAIPRLIAALVYADQEVQMVQPPPQANGNGINASFGGPVNSASPVGSPGFVTSRAVPVLTGPVVANGVVAYGATSVPYNSGFALGTGGATQGPAVPTLVPVQAGNPEVLDALTSLTGQNYGYNIDLWRRWHARAPRPANVPARRVPAP